MSRRFRPNVRPNRRSGANRGRGRALLFLLSGSALTVAFSIMALAAFSEDDDSERPSRGALANTTNTADSEEQHTAAERTANSSRKNSSDSSSGDSSGEDESPDVDAKAARAAADVADATGPEFSVYTEPERAAASYVVSAYGYTGSDSTTYVRGVEEGVIYPDFYDSAGGDHVRSQVSQVEDGGMQSAARLTGFRIRRQSEDRVVGTAFYDTARSYADSGGALAGQTESYTERITLVSSGEGSASEGYSSEGYRVLSASGPRQAGES